MTIGVEHSKQPVQEFMVIPQSHTGISNLERMRASSAVNFIAAKRSKLTMKTVHLPTQECTEISLTSGDCFCERTPSGRKFNTVEKVWPLELHLFC